MKVTVYSTDTCQYCSMAKRYLESKNVAYQEINVSADRASADDMVRKSGQRGVPVIDIDGNIIVGFDKARIDSFL